jgi:hypothetical protein
VGFGSFRRLNQLAKTARKAAAGLVISISDAYLTLDGSEEATCQKLRVLGTAETGSTPESISPTPTCLTQYKQQAALSVAPTANERGARLGSTIQAKQVKSALSSHGSNIQTLSKLLIL